MEIQCCFLLTLVVSGNCSPELSGAKFIAFFFFFF